ncbi:MAG: DUF1553 domain-containing protein [Pirellulaceae bacterium]|nr:DUF1553 domain-containing protein [Pirellulaceae bacterium]
MKLYFKISVLCLVNALIVCAATLKGQDIDGSKAISFQRDILPILSNHCFLCHGPDQGTNESGLRLDLADEALGPLPSDDDNRAIWAGHPERSEIIERIESDDEGLKMPPHDGHIPALNAEQIELVKEWIRQGAHYEPLWSWQPLPVKIPVPEKTDDDWSNNEIDRFVMQGLQEMGLTPSAEADRFRWLRRVSFDLTGLPPTPTDIRDLFADEKPDAHERVVDRLLASHAFGEHFATKWLDVARYGDSYGYQSDMLCTVWPYRDWVVRAFNQNLPYDQFLTWQLAGDLLDEPTVDQRIATAFNRLHRQTNEGGSIDLEWRTEYAADRVHTFGTVFLGLTLECARCHDHKFDAISQRDYYQFMSFFNHIDEHGLYNNSPWVPTPSMLLPNESQRQRDAEIEQELQVALERFAKETVDAKTRFATCLEQGETPAEPQPRIVLDFENRNEQHQFAASGGESPVARTNAANPTVPGKTGQGLRFSGDDQLEIDAFPFSLHQPFTVSMWLRVPAGLREAIIFHQQTGTDAGFSGPLLAIREGKLFFSFVRFWPGNTLTVESTLELTPDAWQHITVSYDGTLTAAGISLYINGEPSTQIVRDRIYKNVHAEAKLHVGERFRSVGLAGGIVDDLRVYDFGLSRLEVRHDMNRGDWAEFWQNAETSDQLDHYLTRVDEPLTTARQAVRNARWARIMNNDGMVELMVMEELPGETPTYVLERGDYDAPRMPERLVERTTIKGFFPFLDDAPRNRLGLAQWATHPDHPLTARVAVNRIWENFFGTGIVETAGDFGVQGSRPTHPELLDWLARDFVEHGWDVKRLCRQIALSATYRQDSRCSAELREADPTNRWLARGPASRLSAEQIRDLALAASQLLKDRNGGPPVSPYQPGDLWRENNSMSPGYSQSQGDDLFRRSLYSVWKRTAPLPNMSALDAAAREVCTVSRPQTNTPVQALVTLNDPQFVEASVHLAWRLSATNSLEETDTMLNEMLMSVCGRPATVAEVAILGKLFREQLALFSTQPENATQMLSIGSSLIPVVELDQERQITLAAWAVVAQAVFNSDAALMKR